MTTTFQGSLQTQNNLAEIFANGMATQMASIANLGITSAINGAASGYIMPYLENLSANNAPLGWSQYNLTTTNIPATGTYGLINTVSIFGSTTPAFGNWIYQFAYPTNSPNASYGWPALPYMRSNINNYQWSNWVSISGNLNASLSVAAATTLTTSSFGQLIEVTGGPYTINIPSPIGMAGATITFWFNTGNEMTLHTPIGNFDGPSGTGTPYFYAYSGNGLVVTITSDGYNWFLPNFGVGENAAWSPVAAAFNTTYTNSYGKPIVVSAIYYASTTPTYISVQVNGSTPVWQATNTTNSNYCSIECVVPPGSTYQVYTPNISAVTYVGMNILY